MNYDVCYILFLFADMQQHYVKIKLICKSSPYHQGEDDQITTEISTIFFKFIFHSGIQGVNIYNRRLYGRFR